MLTSHEPTSFEARRKSGAHLRMTPGLGGDIPSATTATLYHRSFSVERPASASITEMIQNRITICGSVQPFCSKW
jgi:hypothetical protein